MLVDRWCGSAGPIRPTIAGSICPIVQRCSCLRFEHESVNNVPVSYHSVVCALREHGRVKVSR